MAQITIIGAGSVMFTRQICSALLSYPSLAGSTIMLMDIQQDVLAKSGQVVAKMIEQAQLPVTVKMSTDQREALQGADFVINAIQVGGLEPWRLDMDIPAKYGVIQEVGDTMGPGGIFRALRHIPPMLAILRDMEDICPQALFINYANPLAPLTWAAKEFSSIQSIGLCYGVRYTVAQLAGYLQQGAWVDHPSTPERWQQLMYHEVPDHIDYEFAGINHMTWVTKMHANGEDLMAQIRELPNQSEVYQADGVRCEMLKFFNYWCTENHWHCSDYVPYFRKNEEMINHFLPLRWDLLALEEKVHAAGKAEIDAQLAGKQDFIIAPNMLNAPKIINAMLSGERTRINGNVANQQPDGLLIDNLPQNCVVEVPIWVDDKGLQPQAMGSLPTQCASLIKSNTAVQELIVEAALNRDLDAARYALALDPVTATVCTLEQINAMFEKMVEAQQPWLQSFNS
ncbi:alpha-glucosidase/alpha-galactosidase [Photobacterium jeanii]|uniref:Alpha-glucosidase/alpha-galactosidase n=1 Tax=Photobacterium jeanii TaxID=858640 RepID=A0A178K8C2_9GAMM|nr:alpha-galactosidase [Photobacterium jeanii]OAN12994.1 alpha-glucosidase/alpha-galactosidase [Photobacterium jeanii]PST89142.1 alpha-glucosidase/alpha-galactosidase [Photobacterium jeanii]